MQARVVENTPSLGYDVKWRSRVKERHALYTLKNLSHYIVKSRVKTRCGGIHLSVTSSALAFCPSVTQNILYHKIN